MLALIINWLNPRGVASSIVWNGVCTIWAVLRSGKIRLAFKPMPLAMISPAALALSLIPGESYV